MDYRMEYIRLLLNRFKAGECTEEEIAQLHEWLDAQASVSEGEVSPFAGEEDRERVRKELEKRIFGGISSGLSGGRLRRIGWYAAAAILVLAGLTAGYYYYTAAPAWEEHVTGDKISLLTLEDGSRLWMNHFTRVRVRENFLHHRDVQLLQGEVFCDVRHNKDYPFRVSSGTYEVRDLGTAFSVSRYERWQGLKVSVVHGEVQVKDGQEVLDTLYKGQRLRYTAGRLPVIQKDSIADEEAGGWFGNGTVLHDLTLEEIAQWIEMHYRLRVIDRCGAADGGAKYEVQMDREASVTDMVAILNLILKNNHTHLTLKDSTITIVPLANH